MSEAEKFEAQGRVHARERLLRQEIETASAALRSRVLILKAVAGISSAFLSAAESPAFRDRFNFPVWNIVESAPDLGVFNTDARQSPLFMQELVELLDRLRVMWAELRELSLAIEKF